MTIVIWRLLLSIILIHLTDGLSRCKHDGRDHVSFPYGSGPGDQNVQLCAHKYVRSDLAWECKEKVSCQWSHTGCCRIPFEKDCSRIKNANLVNHSWLYCICSFWWSRAEMATSEHIKAPGSILHVQEEFLGHQSTDTNVQTPWPSGATVPCIGGRRVTPIPGPPHAPPNTPTLWFSTKRLHLADSRLSNGSGLAGWGNKTAFKNRKHKKKIHQNSRTFTFQMKRLFFFHPKICKGEMWTSECQAGQSKKDHHFTHVSKTDWVFSSGKRLRTTL